MVGLHKAWSKGKLIVVIKYFATSRTYLVPLCGDGEGAEDGSGQGNVVQRVKHRPNEKQEFDLVRK